MSLKNIRKAYNVPAFRGTRVRVSSPYPGGLGTITSSDRQYIRVRLTVKSECGDITRPIEWNTWGFW